MLLFVIFGWGKLVGFSGTVGYTASTGMPAPTLVAIVAVVMEFLWGSRSCLVFTRGHSPCGSRHTPSAQQLSPSFWTLAGDARMENMINFYKNISIAGSLLLLCVTGTGKHSIDKR